MAGSKRVSRTDWAKVDATTDEDIARQIAEDPDTAPEWTEEDFDNAEVWDGNHYLGRGKDFRGGKRIGRPLGSGKKELVTLRLDYEILDHFRAGGPGWQTRLNDKLREVVQSRRPPRGNNARLIAEVLQAMPSAAARPADIRKALQSAKGVSLAFTSIRHALGQLAERHEVAPSDDGKTWHYIGSP